MATFDEIIKSNNVVLVDFFATWCGPCQTMAPILQDVKEFYDESLSIIKIDVDKNPKIASIYKVSGVPTFAYELEKAVEDGYLVDYKTLEVKSKKPIPTLVITPCP